MLFIEYPKCSTCKKAKKHLEDLGVQFEDRNIVEENPTAEELRTWIGRSGYPVKKFFNTSGMKYRELGLKDKLPQMSDEEKIKRADAVVDNSEGIEELFEKLQDFLTGFLAERS